MNTKTKFNIEVELTGTNGNAFSILGKVIKALKRDGATSEQVEEFRTEAMSSNYDHLLQTCMKWVDVS